MRSFVLGVWTLPEQGDEHPPLLTNKQSAIR